MGGYEAEDQLPTDTASGTATPVVPVTAMMSENGRIDYSSRFESDLENFRPGYQLQQGELKEDLILVQFHGDSELGDGRSAKWWTTTEQANSASTVEEIMKALALPPEWGERNSVSVARIPKGTDITSYVGKAKEQLSNETLEVYDGGGVQYRFKDFDPSWIVETRKID